MKSAHQVTQAINSDVIPHPRDLYGCDYPKQPVLELDRVDDVLQALRVVRNHGDSQ
jgi:hypothetical protein